jgi:hypothetical protein
VSRPYFDAQWSETALERNERMLRSRLNKMSKYHCAISQNNEVHSAFEEYANEVYSAYEFNRSQPRIEPVVKIVLAALPVTDDLIQAACDAQMELPANSTQADSVRAAVKGYLARLLEHAT